MNKKLLVPAGFFLTAAMFWIAGCADDPSPVGLSILPSGDRVIVDSLSITATESFSEKAIPVSFTVAPQTIALGKVNGFESWGFIQFSGFPDFLSTATIQSAELRLHSSYHLGDSLGQLSLAIHKGLSDWNRLTFVYDSLSVPGIFDPSAVNVNLGSFGDTAAVTVPIDTSLVREWIMAVSDANFVNYGVILEPTNSTVIKGFRSVGWDSTSERPMLTVRYMMSGSVQVDTLVLTSSVDKFVAGAADTTFLQDSVLVTARGGAAYRGVVGFSLSSLPAHAAIHQAALDITVDAASSEFTSNEHDSLFALFAGVRNPVQYSTLVSIPGKKVYRFPVTEFVQAMVQGVGEPRIRISVLDEENMVGAFAINGSAAVDPSLRPKLTILFSRTR